MNIMLLGNGFDLHYKLPTKYINFLNVVHHLACHYNSQMTSIGAVFNDSELQKQDPFIEESYACYKDTYDAVALDPAAVEKLITLSKNNIWFNYLLSSYNTDIGWIDFEKEIGTICNIFQILFQNSHESRQGSDLYFNLVSVFPNASFRYIILNFFNFFGSNKNHSPLIPSENPRTVYILPEYCLEVPVGSGYRILNKKAIVERLNRELLDLAEMLRLYLTSFSDNVCKDLIAQGQFSPIGIPVDYAVTFNYTHTFETLYDISAAHIHGSTDSSIVLGINADEFDEVEAADTTFIMFKKYFQRILYRSDTEYLNFVKKYNTDHYSHECCLFVIGHSLDITDAEMIRELFNLSTEITVLSHNLDAVGSYIANLIKIFGKQDFDQFRSQKNLRFKLLDEELDEILAAEANKEEKAKKIQRMMGAIPLC